MKLKMLGLAFFLTIFNLTQSANILGIFPIPSRSHTVMGLRIMKELENRGHTVTVVSPYEHPGIVGNRTGINIRNTVTVFKHAYKNLHDQASMNFLSTTNHLHQTAYDLTAALLTDSNFQNLLHSTSDFDLVIMEYFMNEAALGVAKVFGAPLVVVSSLPSSTLSNHLFANPLPSAFVPNLLAPFSGEMAYWERFRNFVYNAYNNYYRALRMLPLHEELLKKHLGKTFDLHDVISSVNFILLNSHPSVTEPVPLMPNMVEVGGIHIGPQGNIPDDLEDFLNNSKNGVILFSMDTNLESRTVQSLINAFDHMEQDVIWEAEEEFIGFSDNVKSLKKVSPTELLAHPKVKAFVSHGGLLSTIEAVYFGVPMVGVPVYGDQKSNVARAVHDGYAVSLPFTDMSGVTVAAAIREVLRPEYGFNIAQRSKALRDRMVDPIDSAIFWTEFVMKHNGAKYFQSPGVKLPSYKKHLIDVIILLVIIDVVLFLVFYYIFKHIIHYVWGKLKQRKSQEYSKL